MGLGDDEDDDDDDEEIVRLPLPHTRGSSAAAAAAVVVIYDIIYSPSYQVPVLYIQCPTSNFSPDCLVPSAYKRQINSVGVMGALSMTEHPVTGLPVYFVHPCRTQEMMAARGQLGPEEYLMVWFGVIGAGVGLNVPVALARSMVGGGRGPAFEGQAA
ncbi:Hypothetical predicted protein [Lecanosticta acicola]|uniref:Ubiquitin-like-conjugating enzyme ATG10 n=1 Tax=Lecanosticta acicola TaxID=111012 RepID=A0AAI8Z0D2_9PEZI|nr:Hypothetical predicted protein [Lecanosticta acicola]